MKLSEISQDLVTLVEKASPIVYRVDARHRLPSTGTAWESEGVIVTAHHTVELEEGIRVGLESGQEYSARLVGRDPTTDLAVLKIEGQGSLPAAGSDIAGNSKTGSLVLALGRPGSRLQASLGIVQAAGPAWRTGAGGAVDSYLQTSVEMLPGFSGGPLLDMEGGIVGINTSALRHNGSLTLPAATVSRVVKSLLEHGRIRRAYLGITSQPVRLGEDAARTAGQPSGLMIISLETGGPAATGGVLQGDILLSVGRTPTRRMEDLVAALTTNEPTGEITLGILRGGIQQVLQVKPIEKE